MTLDELFEKTKASLSGEILELERTADSITFLHMPADPRRAPCFMFLNRATVSSCILPEALELARMIGNSVRTRGSAAVDGGLLEAVRELTTISVMH